MIKQLDRYGAVCAKVRGMYGKRLTPEDWERLQSAGSAEQAGEILSRTTAWGPLPDGLGAEALRRALRERLREECGHLEHFLQNEADRKYLEYFLNVKEHAAAMDTAAYRDAWQYLMRDYKGLSAIAARRLLGTEADMLNVTYLLRLRRFPALRDKAGSYLIPVHLELTPALATAVLDAPDDDAARGVLHGTKMAAVFADRAQTPEVRCRTYMEAFCRKLVTGGEPSLAVPAAYLMGKDLQRRRLDRLLEALRLGLDPGKIR